MSSPFLSKAFLSLFFQNFCVLGAINALNVLPDHLAAVGASKTYIGLYMNLASLMVVALAVPLSDHADLFGRKRLVLWSFGAAMATFAASFFSPDRLVLLAVFRAAGSVLFAVAFTVISAEMFGRLPRERRFSGMAIYGISGLAANPLGTWIGEALAKGPGPRWLFAAAFAFTAAGFVPALRHVFHEREADSPRSASFLKLLSRSELYPLSILAALLGGAYAVFATFLVNLTRERFDAPTITAFFVSFSAVAVCIRLFLGRFLESVKPRLLLAVCFSLEAAAFCIAFFMRDIALLVPTGLIFGVGHSIMYPLLSTMFVNSGTDADRLGLNTLYSATNMGGNILTAVLMGVLADAAGLSTVFAAMIFLCLAMAPLALLAVGRAARAASGAR